MDRFTCLRATTFLRERPHLVPCLVAAAMCFIAIADHPYAYYTLLRIVTFVAALVGLMLAWRSQTVWAIWMFGVVAVLFNPIAPIHLTKDIWRYLDALAGLGLIVGGLVVRAEDTENTVRSDR